MSTPAQEAGIAALEEKEYVERARNLIFKEKEYLMRQLKELGYQVCDSQANYIFFHGEEDLGKKLLEERCV